MIALNRESCTKENLDSLLIYLGPWSPLAFILASSLAPILFIPGTVMTVIGGFIFGLPWGFVYSLIGNVIGASLAFLIARYIAHDWAEKRSHELLVKVQNSIEKDGWRYVAFTRLVPIFPYSILNYVFGLTRISLLTFALTSFLCLIPGTLVYSYIGYVGHEAASGSKDLLLQVSIALALILLLSFFSRKKNYQASN